MYALQGLHSKLYIFDGNSVIMGSANFTFNGFYRHHEFGMFMEKEPLFSAECNNYYDGLLRDIKNSGDWEITQAKIEEEKPTSSLRVIPPQHLATGCCGGITMVSRF